MSPMFVQTLLSSILGAGILVLSILSQASLWQRKEYRWDRMKAHIKEIEFLHQARSETPFAAIALVLGWITYVEITPYVSLYMGWIALLLFCTYHIRRIYRRGIIRPVWTKKAVLLCLVVMFFVAGHVFLTQSSTAAPPLQYATTLFFIPVYAAASVVLVNALTGLRKNVIIQNAKMLRRKNQHCVVVGITGSVGKTSVKHFLQQLIEGSGIHARTSKDHRNSEIGIALDLLEQLNEGIAVYIAEMGAYRKGEIGDLVKLVQPRVGVITAITNQHLALFGSQHELIHAKWELLEGLPHNGTCVLNKDDRVIAKHAASLTKNVVWYSSTSRADVYADNIVYDTTSTTCDIHVGKQVRKSTVPLPGRGSLSNVLAAVAVAYSLGMPTAHIQKRISGLLPYDQTMKVAPGLHGSTIIDDSYSGSEAAAINALEHLGRFGHKHKRVIFTPIIELGNQAKRVHMHIGEAASRVASEMIVYGTSYVRDVERGYGALQRDKTIYGTSNWRRLLTFAISHLSNDTVVLLEGRIPEIVRKHLLVNTVRD